VEAIWVIVGGALWYLSPPGWTKDRMNAWTPKSTPDEKRAG
jgi:hypothetical protein